MNENSAIPIVEPELQEDAIYVHGHINPDTDTITSAITYAYLKNHEDPANHYQAVRLGDINRETEFVLNYYGLPTPPYLAHIWQRVAEAMVKEVVTAPASMSLYQTGLLMRKSHLRVIPLLSEENKAVGMVTERTLAHHFLGEFRSLSLRDAPPTVEQVAETLGGTILCGDPHFKLTGHPLVGAMSPEEMAGHIEPGDVILIGDRPNAQMTAIKSGISCLIVTGNLQPEKQVLELARQKGVPVILSPHTTFVSARLLRLSVSAQAVTDDRFLATHKETLLSEFAPDLMQDNNGVALVVNEENHLEGIITRHDLIAPRRRRIILVDHSEKSQSIDGIESAEILEIVDHHRLGGLETGQPIFAYVKPVGCTATLVWQRYQELELDPPREIAGLLAAAILSDTMLLRSPTVTAEDRQTLAELKYYLNEDPLEFGIRMYNAKTDLAGMSIEALINTDSKVFHFSRYHVQISQIEVVDYEPLMNRLDEIREAMEQQRQARRLDIFILTVTNVLKEASYMIVSGNKRLVERAYRIKLENGTAYLPGIMSRKKQIVPPLAQLA